MRKENKNNKFIQQFVSSTSPYNAISESITYVNNVCCSVSAAPYADTLFTSFTLWSERKQHIHVHTHAYVVNFLVCMCRSPVFVYAIKWRICIWLYTYDKCTSTKRSILWAYCWKDSAYMKAELFTKLINYNHTQNSEVYAKKARKEVYLYVSSINSTPLPVIQKETTSTNTAVNTDTWQETHHTHIKTHMSQVPTGV